ncbi:hypothetical protein BDZ94DRAFT_740824 [Collybia nuda]|uniref:Uncharacterized protein n=1 Tax=Collybia nuda TaxID=64659 RepID=A0A9P6CHE3_9AGAR|nr:hypothetical protein BDZ94DRAFT_740824 [Collybia nuda]
MPSQVLCKCASCRKHTVILDNVPQAGCLVSFTTRRSHEKRAVSTPPRPVSPSPRQKPTSSRPPNQQEVSSHPMDIIFPSSTVIKMICILVVWLHIWAGISRSVVNTILKAFQLIISMTLQLIEAALCSSGISIRFPDLAIPQDIWTAYARHFLEPEIICTVCCPTCFSLYPQPAPIKCQWKESPRSRSCNTDLWKSKNTSKGPKMVPRRLYSTQSFDTWLQFFLSWKVIVDSLAGAFHQRGNRPAAFGGDMCDVQDSPAWQDLTGIFSTPITI